MPVLGSGGGRTARAGLCSPGKGTRVAGGRRGAVGMPVLGWISRFPAPEEIRQGLAPEVGLLEGFPRSLEARWGRVLKVVAVLLVLSWLRARSPCPLAAVHR